MSNELQEEICKIVERELEKDRHIFFSGWRPAMGWSYLIVCTFDFLLAPIFFTVYQTLITGGDMGQFIAWEPQTIKGGGLYHIAMLAIVGAATYGRTKEKLQRLSSESNDTEGLT